MSTFKINLKCVNSSVARLSQLLYASLIIGHRQNKNEKPSNGVLIPYSIYFAGKFNKFKLTIWSVYNTM